MKNQGELSLLVRFAKDTPTAKILGITHPDDLSLYIFTEGEILLMIRASDTFVKNDHKPASFQANIFYSQARPLLE